MDIFGIKKRKQEKIERENEQKLMQDNLHKTIDIQKKANENSDKFHKTFQKELESLQQEKEDIANERKEFQIERKDFQVKVDSFNKKFDETNKLQEQLKIQENRLNEWEKDLKEKIESNRKSEISLHIREESVKKDEARVNQKDRDLDNERENIKEREKRSDRIYKESEEKIEKYNALQKEAQNEKEEYKNKIKDLEDREKTIKENELDIKNRLSELEQKERNFSTLESKMKEDFEAQKEKWEKDRSEIESNLNEKIKEYDRKLADMEALNETIDNMKFDDSEDGKKAKIVVKESIRVAMKNLEDSLEKFKELDSKYASGSFKGFSVPFDEISLVHEELKSDYEGIRDNVAQQQENGIDFSPWLEIIESCLQKADKEFKSHNFCESYRANIEGLSYCKGYISMINLFNEMQGGSDSNTESSEWEDYYEILFEDEFDISFDYTTLDIESIKKQHKKMVKKYHPDTHQDEKERYEEIMKKLNEIYEILKDKDKRESYDKKWKEKSK